MFQALLDHTKGGLSRAGVVLVVSNVAAVKGLERAEKAGVATKVSGGGKGGICGVARCGGEGRRGGEGKAGRIVSGRSRREGGVLGG